MYMAARTASPQNYGTIRAGGAMASRRGAAAHRVAAINSHMKACSSNADTSSEPPRPKLLAGVRVLELATVVAAPSACAILADLGADVLKIENAGAPDYVRAFSKRDDPQHTADPDHLAEEDGFIGSGFTQFNRGKRALALDYRTPAGLKILKQLLAQTDVLVTNVRLKGLERGGLDYNTLKAEYPALIFAHLSAWGLTGPRQDDPGYDVGAFFAYT
jgi:crotonobetainyl-CoA:carnitine CoA-transferase CaiB-like acyl-CoA transferase